MNDRTVSKILMTSWMTIMLSWGYYVTFIVKESSTYFFGLAMTLVIWVLLDIWVIRK